MEENRNAFQDWMVRTRNAARHLCREDGLYAGESGCRRFARECAPAVLDFGEYGERQIGATYSGICVIAYDLRPPVSAAQWLGWIREVIEEEKNRRKPAEEQIMEAAQRLHESFAPTEENISYHVC